MKDQISEDELNRILAQPAQIADRGFTEQVRTRLKKSESKRMVVFAAIAVFWTALAILIGFPEQLLNSLSLPDTVFEDLFVTLIDILPLRESLAFELSRNSSLLGVIFTVFLALFIALKLGEE